MRKSWALLCLLVVAMFATKSSANIITVSQFGTADYDDIWDAVQAATNNGVNHVDTILVGEGTYGLDPSDNFLISAEKIVMIGAGWDKVRFNGYFRVSGQVATGTKIVGMRFDYPGYSCRVQNDADSVTIERCVLNGGDDVYNSPTLDLNGGIVRINDCILIAAVDDAHAVYLRQQNSAEVKFEGCVLSHATGGHDDVLLYCYNNPAGPAFFYNCVFLNVRWFFYFEADDPDHPLHVTNCVFYDWSTGGTRNWGNYHSGSVFRYVACGLNHPAFPGSFENTVILPENPFVDYNPSFNYQIGVTNLQLDSTANGGNLLRNTGHPNIFDLDGTRSDFGVYGGPKPLVDNGVPAYPFVVSLDVPGAVQPASDLNINSAGRVGPHY